MNTFSPVSRNVACSVGSFVPFAEFEREFQRLISETQDNSASVGVPVDVLDEPHQLTLVVDLPGVRREEIQIAFKDGVLTLAAERKPGTDPSQSTFLVQERYQGQYQRRLALRTLINGDAIKASYRDGVLTVILPKTEAAKPKQISVTE